MISKTGEYALRAVLHLAQRGTAGPQRASQIARELGVPPNYLSKILHALARAGTLKSERGPGGGFRLARPPSEVALAEVLEPFDPMAREQTCLLGRPECSERNACMVHERWKRVREPVAQFFRETTIADLLGGTVLE